jgi:uncharacterized membrane protein YcaP (DUF421 family)
MQDIAAITIKLTSGLVLLFIVTKLLGKEHIKMLTPFHFISSLILGEILGNAIYNKDVKFTYLLYAVFLWGLMMGAIEILTLKFNRTRALLSGMPAIIIKDGIIDHKLLKKNRIDLNQLQSLLRQRGVFSMREIKFGIIEENGEISVVKKFEYDTPTNKDLNLQGVPFDLPFTVIIDGEIIRDNLQEKGLDENWLKKQLKANGIMDVKDVFFAEWRGGEGLHISPMQTKK